MKTVVITGGHRGRGLYIVRELSRRGYRVILGSRDRGGIRNLVAGINMQLKSGGQSGEVVFYPLDLADLQSAESFSAALSKDYRQIDVLILNAFIKGTPYCSTEDGYELQFQVNFLTHFYLVHLLQPLLEESEHPKVISLCDTGAEKGKIDSVSGLNDLSSCAEEECDPIELYRESRLAQEITLIQLSKESRFQKIHFSLVHPGFSIIPLFFKRLRKGFRILTFPVLLLGYLLHIFQTPKRGASTVISLVCEDDFPNGKYWYRHREQKTNAIARNQEYRQALIQWARGLLDINPS